MNHSAGFSANEPGGEAAGKRASRPSSDRLALTGRAGHGVASYRSDFLHAWLVGSGRLPEAVEDGLLDLETSSLALPPGAMPPPETALPLAIHQFFTGVQFLRDTLWGPWCGGIPPALFGILTIDNRVWAFACACEPIIEQLTGPPKLTPWQTWESASGILWRELESQEVSRITLANPEGGPLHAHYRPNLGAVAGAAATPVQPTTGEEQEEEENQTTMGAGAGEAVASSSGPASTEEESVPGESRQARRRRRRRERAKAALKLVPPADAPPDGEPAPASPAGGARPFGANRTPTPLVAMPGAAPLPGVSLRGEPARRAPSPLEPLVRALAPIVASKQRLIGVVSGLALVVLGTIAFVAREPIARVVVGRYSLEVSSAPKGATVRVDGELMPGTTPLVLPLVPGEHRIELAYDKYASEVFTVDGERDQQVTRTVNWAGSIGLASADTTTRVQVSFDGRSWGALPIWKDDVPVGRHRLSFTGEGVRPWEEEVEVKDGQSTRVLAEPVRVPPYGLVTARAERLTMDGVEEVNGAVVFVDGQRAGATPADLKLDPGPHSIRILSGDLPSPVHLIDVQAGGRYFASTQFGRAPDPSVWFDAPKRISVGNPPTLTVVLVADVPLPVREMWLWVRSGSGPYERQSVTLAPEQSRPRGTVTFPTVNLAPGRPVSYYVAIETREGEEYYSELRTVPVTH